MDGDDLELTMGQFPELKFFVAQLGIQAFGYRPL